jgi:Flp pilus assembly protein TadG
MSRNAAAFLRDTRGNFATILAVSALPVMLAAGVAVDFAQASRYDARLQNAVDAATLAAGRELSKISDAAAKALVKEHVEANLEADDSSQLQTLDIAIDRTKMAIVVNAAGRMTPNFAPIVGMTKMDYHVTASAQAAFGGIEIVLVLDNTGSMEADNKMAGLKTAATAFIAEMTALNVGETRVKIGIVPFSEYVNIGMDNRNASWMDVTADGKSEQCGDKQDLVSKSGCFIKTGTYLVDGVEHTGSWEECASYVYGPVYQACWPVETQWHGCAGSRQYPLNLKDAVYGTRIPGAMDRWCPNRITELTDNKKKLTDEIAALITQGNTYIPAGLIWGLRAISSKSPFTEGATPAAAGTKNITKAIILMTDGENTISQIGGSHLHDGSDVAQSNDWTLEGCDAIKKEKVKLYTVSFGSGVPQATKDMLAACSSGKGYHFDAAGSGDLNKAFADIAAALTRLYLTQ